MNSFKGENLMQKNMCDPGNLMTKFPEAHDDEFKILFPSQKRKQMIEKIKQVYGFSHGMNKNSHKQKKKRKKV